MEIKRGEIMLANLNPVKGSEQGGVRPVLVIQNNISNQLSPTIIVAPITSVRYDKEYPTDVFISRDESGLNKDSRVLLNQIKTIDKRRIINKISYLNSFIMHKVDLAIKASLGLNF